MARSLRGLGIRRNEVGKVRPPVFWRCDQHHRLNHPDYPGCGCESPFARAVLRDDAELRACRAMKWQEDVRVRGKPPRRLDYEAIRAMPGPNIRIAESMGCTAAMVSLIKRGRR